MSCNQHWDCADCRKERESSADKSNAHSFALRRDIVALKARLVVAGIRAERAEWLLAEAQVYVERCGAEGLMDRIAALLKGVSHGQQG